MPWSIFHRVIDSIKKACPVPRKMVKEDVDLHGRLEEAEMKTFLRGYGEKFQAVGPPL